MYRVGQRVKLVRPKDPRKLGITGTIVEIWKCEQPSNTGAPINCSVEWDNGTRCLREWEYGQPGFATHTSQLEPLTPPHEACDDAEFIASLDRLAAKVEEMA